jgi:hypothetical protein
MIRWKKVEMLQAAYPHFVPFMEDVMDFLGFNSTELQKDIAGFLQYGPVYLMIQAQRGQAKTTVAAAFCIWSLIHDPKFRVLIVSAGGKQANEISTLIVRLILTMGELEMLRPDPTNGDRVSVEAFDLHYTLKGVDKSPSVACIGVGGNLQGKRADILLADDVESSKNSLTAVMRDQLLNVMRDFPSICSSGRIVYLGTPQTMESVYNTLPASGFEVRIWPGRYPTHKQAAHYGDNLAPLLRNRLANNPMLGMCGGVLGDQGQPTDSVLFGEEALQKKEMAQGAAFFQLQHMLNTALNDAMRYPLKPANLVVMRLAGEYFPLEVTRGMDVSSLRQFKVGSTAFCMSAPHKVSQDVAKLQGRVMYVDPAGGGKNGDETAYAVTGFLNGNVYLLAVGGVPGGYSIEQMEALTSVAEFWKPDRVIIEKNMGYGAFREVWIPLLFKKYKCAVEDDMVHGQKETRIIETLEPVMSRGSLIINEDCVSADEDGISRYAANIRQTYSFFHQLTKLTRDKGALRHDDRLDAVEGAVRAWVKQLLIDQTDAVKKARDAEHTAWAADPFNKQRYDSKPSRGGSLFNKYRR